jgi:hypothetical protein
VTRAKAAPPPDTTSRYPLRMSPHLLARVRAMAKAQNRTINSLLCELIAESIGRRTP